MSIRWMVLTSENWVANGQRKAKDSMSAERKQRLDDIGFVWDTFYLRLGKKGSVSLLQFKEAEGHCRVA